VLISSSLSAKALGDFDQPSVAEFRDSPAAANSRVETQMWSVEDSAYSSSVLCFVLTYPCALDNTSFLPLVRVASLIVISNLSDDRSTASSKTIPPLNAI
jgi:hypothetical protein